MKAIELVTAFGHKNILAANKTTFEITKDTFLTKRGDCIIAVAADKSGVDFGSEFKEILRRRGSKLTIIIQTDSEREVAKAFGDPRLALDDPDDLVVRKSSYVCNRTLAINADKAANDFPRPLVEKLKNPQQKISVTLIAENAMGS